MDQDHEQVVSSINLINHPFSNELTRRFLQSRPMFAMPHDTDDVFQKLLKDLDAAWGRSRKRTE